MYVPVLTYHGIHVDGERYATNDHIGLERDLEFLHSSDWNIINVQSLVDAVTSGRFSNLPARSVVLTFDDGSWFDWYDLPHPHYGAQRGLAGILTDFRVRHGEQAQPGLHATSFVIVSPEARDALDQTCLIGRGWWGHEWWPRAHRDGLISIASHSWDHRHASLPEDAWFGTRPYGDFHELADEQECDWQVRQAQTVLNRLLGQPAAPVFAYPYGHVPEILADEYFPRHGEALGLSAAFSGEPEPVHAGSDRWRLPRFVFRRDWSSPDGLAALLREVEV